MPVREARPDERPAVMTVLDSAMLEVDAGTVRDRIGSGAVLVATADGDRILGALVLDGARIEAVAVRRRRRGQGIGTALVAAAVDRHERVTAAFDDRVRPFYEALGFDIEPAAEEGRWRGGCRSVSR